MFNLSSLKNTAFASAYFFIQGIGGTLPWCGVLSSLDFYRARYPTGRVDFVFPIVCLLSSLIVNFSMVAIKAKYSINARIAYSNLLCLAFLILMPSVAIMLPGTLLGYWIILLIFFIVGAINTVTCTSILGIAGYFHSQCMTNYNMGAGVAGIILNVLRITIMLVLPDASKQTDVKGIVIYYGISAWFIVACVMIHFRFIESKYAREQLLAFGEVVPSSSEMLEKDKRKYAELGAESPGDTSQGSDGNDISTKEIVEPKENFEELMGTFNETRLLNTITVINFAITCTLFPGVMLMNPMGGMNAAWKVVLLELAFNIFDTIGKLITSKSWMVCGERAIGVLVICRLIFFFTYIIEATIIGFPLVGEKWFAYLNTALFGLTGGYAQGVLFILGPEKVEGKKKETIGFLLSTALNLGVLAGALLGLPLSYLPQDSVWE